MNTAFSPPGKATDTRQVVVGVKDLSVGYSEDKILLKSLNFEIYAGEIFMIVGGSGVGKTTLLQNLVGLIAPLQGDIQILGEDLYSLDSKNRAHLLQSVGVTYQQGALFSSLTVFENLAFPLREFTDMPEEIIESMCRLKLGLVSLDGCEDYMPDQLSGGMVKRVAIARAMMLDPGVIFFDEPGSGLDPLLANDLDNLIQDLARNLGVTFVIVSHDLRSIFKIADRVALLDRMQVGSSFIGRPEDSEQIKKMYKTLAFEA